MTTTLPVCLILQINTRANKTSHRNTHVKGSYYTFDLLARLGIKNKQIKKTALSILMCWFKMYAERQHVPFGAKPPKRNVLPVDSFSVNSIGSDLSPNLQIYVGLKDC